MYIHSTDIRTRVKCLIHNANTNPGFYIWSLLLCKCLQCSKADVKIKPYAYLKISKNTTSWKNMFWIFENGFFDAITQISLFYFWDIIWANIKMFHTLNLIFVPSQNQAILHALLINCNKHKGCWKLLSLTKKKFSMLCWSLAINMKECWNILNLSKKGMSDMNIFCMSSWLLAINIKGLLKSSQPNQESSLHTGH